MVPYPVLIDIIISKEQVLKVLFATSLIELSLLQCVKAFQYVEI